MEAGITFVIGNVILGVGLAMDAFSVSVANGLNERCMKKRRMCYVAGTFAFFQALMPLLGWLCVHTVAKYFKNFEILIPWIALGLLGYIGISMLMEGVKNNCCEETQGVGFVALILQGVATSIDALSAGFVISDYNLPKAVGAALIIALITFVICMVGLDLGKRAGKCLAGRANILGGCILILIGLEIFITSWL